MEIRRYDRSAVNRLKDNSNLSTSIQASEASAQMYDSLTNSFHQLADVATTSAINAEIRKSSETGEMAGIEGTRQDEDGSFEGYEKKSEVFKWGVASNQASKASFEAGVSSRASTSMKSLSKDVNGDKESYTTVAQKLLSDALMNVTDEQQRQHITNSYAKAYNQNMANVSTTYLKNSAKMAKDGWDAGREVFEEDYSIKLTSILRKERDFTKAQDEGDNDKATQIYDDIVADKEGLIKYINARQSQGAGAIQMAVMSPEGIVADTHTDAVKAIGTAYASEYANTDSVEGRAKLREEIRNMPEDLATTDGVFALTPKAKVDVLAMMDKEELRDAKMWNNANSLEKAEFEIDKREAIGSVQTGLIMDSDTVLDDIDRAFKNNYISESQFNAYREHALNGSEVSRDNLRMVGEVRRNIHAYTTDDIADMADITDVTKRSLIGDRANWEEEGEKWMSQPDYNEGENIIRDSFGFNAKSVLPEVLTKSQEMKYKEMLRVLDDHRSQVRDLYAKGDRNAGVRLAEDMIALERNNENSVLYNKYSAQRVYTKEMVVKKAERDNTSLQKVMDDVYSKNKDAVFSSDIKDATPDDKKPRYEKPEEIDLSNSKTKRKEGEIL